MATYKKRPDFFLSEEGDAFKQALRDMAHDLQFITEPGYSANTELYPDNAIPFVEKHVEYIKTHPTIDPSHYLSNLRLMTRVR